MGTQKRPNLKLVDSNSSDSDIEAEVDLCLGRVRAIADLLFMASAEKHLDSLLKDTVESACDSMLREFWAIDELRSRQSKEAQS